uniref:Uncharacterized protein n=1 Tax=Aquila chrysaetos chrysaetos TaxID=223781 RepID=A0A663EQ98_AQUCH
RDQRGSGQPAGTALGARSQHQTGGQREVRGKSPAWGQPRTLLLPFPIVLMLQLLHSSFPATACARPGSLSRVKSQEINPGIAWESTAGTDSGAGG